LFYIDEADYQQRVAARKKMAAMATVGFHPVSQ
jgi:hypothetical protein